MKKVFFYLLFSISFVTLFAYDLSDFIDDVYLQTKTDEELQSIYDRLYPSLTDVYEQAVLNYQMARVYQMFDDVETTLAHNKQMQKGAFVSLFDFYDQREKAIFYFEKSLELTQKHGNEARWVALKASTISQLALVKSPGYTLVYGPKVEKLAKKTLEMDSTNMDAQLLIANSKIYPPKIYFGNPQKGIEFLKGLNRNGLVSKENNFNIMLGFAYSYGRINETSLALEFIDKALELYPTNKFALAVRQLIQQGELK